VTTHAPRADGAVDVARDRALVQRFQAGEREAFEELYRRYRGRVLRSCLKRLGDPHDAEDATQEAFARAYRALGNLGGEQRFYPWLSVIAAHVCADLGRRRARAVPVAEVAERGVEHDAAEAVFAALDARLLGRAFARLAPRHKEALALREEAGCSYEEIAARQGVSVATVESLLFRARRALRREVELLERTGPVLGLVLAAAGRVARVWRRLRDAARLAGEQPLAGGGAVALAGSLALAATMLVGPFGARSTPASIRAAGRAPMLFFSGPSPGVSPVRAATGGRPFGRRGADMGEGGAQEPSGTVPGARPRLRAVGGVVVTGAALAKAAADAEPLHADVGGVSVGADPARPLALVGELPAAPAALPPSPLGKGDPLSPEGPSPSRGGPSPSREGPSPSPSLSRRLP
jgi:RNA polymerase sigma-70 factor (ECF subfamily)